MEKAMIIKSVIAGLTLGGAAFGGVYYGLPAMTPEGAIKPADMARLEPATPQTQDRHSDDVRMAEAHPHPEKMKPKKVEADDEEMSETSKNEEKPETKWIDNYLKKSEADDSDETENDMPEPDMDEGDSDSADMEDIIDHVKTDIKGEMDEMSEPKTVIKADRATGTYKVKTPMTSQIMSIVLREAADIKSDDLKDQAHMDIIGYALRENKYDTAKDVIALINQPELRETARSRVAVSYAKDGQAEAAFDMIDTVEMADFADVMRLQVIEALTHSDHMSNIMK